jgi:hypothetical protein
MVRPPRIDLGLRVRETPINESIGSREQFRFRCDERRDEHKASGLKVLEE